MRNWKTTLSGIALIIGAVAMYVNDQTKINEAIVGVTAGLGLIFAKDNDVSGTGNGLIGTHPKDR